jgi:hypothetical protein
METRILGVAVGAALIAALAGDSTAVAQEGKTKVKVDKPLSRGPLSSAAETRERDVVGVLYVSTDGVSETAAEKFENSLEEGLKLHGFQVARRKTIQGYLANSEFIEGCLFGPCLREVNRVTKGKVRLVLIANIHGEGTAYRFLISLLDTRTGAPTAQIPTGCTVCTVEEAIAAATLAVVELVAGTGDAAVLAPTGPTGDAPEPKSPDDVGKRLALRHASIAFFGAGLIAGAAAAILLVRDRDAFGYTALGAGSGLVAGGATLFLISTRF